MRLPPKVIFEAVQGLGLTQIILKVDQRDPADAGLELLRRLLPAARDVDALSRSKEAASNA